MLHHANGECGSCHENDGHQTEPWALYEDDETHVTMGLMDDLHADHCLHKTYGDAVEDCYCESVDFSWHACQGCGSNLGGSRHAFTGWLED
jgi:hypothetical protein